MQVSQAAADPPLHHSTCPTPNPLESPVKRRLSSEVTTHVSGFQSEFTWEGLFESILQKRSQDEYTGQMVKGRDSSPLSGLDTIEVKWMISVALRRGEKIIKRALDSLWRGVLFRKLGKWGQVCQLPRTGVCQSQVHVCVCFSKAPAGGATPLSPAGCLL